MGPDPHGRHGWGRPAREEARRWVPRGCRADKGENTGSRDRRVATADGPHHETGDDRPHRKKMDHDRSRSNESNPIP
jgi:hypothetical protein